MPYNPIPARPISPAELAVLRATLSRAPSDLPVHDLRTPLEELQVVSVCPCGCDSVDFSSQDIPRSRPLAHGIGTKPFGGEVGILVWGTDHDVTGLEVYDLAFDEKGIRLPIPDSVKPGAA